VVVAEAVAVAVAVVVMKAEQFPRPTSSHDIELIEILGYNTVRYLPRHLPESPGTAMS